MEFDRQHPDTRAELGIEDGFPDLCMENTKDELGKTEGKQGI